MVEDAKMRIALKYGISITAGVVAWVIIAHTLVPNPASPVHSLGAAVFFNVLEVAGIYFGLRALQKESNGVLSFKAGVKMGVAIAFVYGLTASLFFIQVIWFAPQWVQAKSGVQDQPLWQAALGAFFGLIAGAVLFGLIYATIISFLLIRTQEGRSYS